MANKLKFATTKTFSNISDKAETNSLVAYMGQEATTVAERFNSAYYKDSSSNIFDLTGQRVFRTSVSPRKIKYYDAIPGIYEIRSGIPDKKYTKFGDLLVDTEYIYNSAEHYNSNTIDKTNIKIYMRIDTDNSNKWILIHSFENPDTISGLITAGDTGEAGEISGPVIKP